MTNLDSKTLRYWGVRGGGPYQPLESEEFRI